MATFKYCFCLILVLLFDFDIVNVAATPVQVNDFTTGISSFAKDLYWECGQSESGNVIISPLSVSTALTLLLQGANGNTFDELKNRLHLSGDKSTIANQFFDHFELLHKNVGNSTLSIANKIYVGQGYQLNKNFEEVAVEKFKSGIETLDFAEPSESAQIINHFVEEKTNGKIKELIKPESLRSDTRSILVNALYFKGNWEHRFKEKFTNKKDFYINENKTVSVDFMFTNEKFNYADSIDDLEASALEMKYADSKLSFVIVLPHSRTGLPALEAKLKDYDLTKIIEKMHSGSSLYVFIPKFKVEFEIGLNNVLKKLGLNEIFAENSDLSGLLDSNEPLRVSDVIHKTFIEINEQGAEAAAVTGAFSIDNRFFESSPIK